MSAEVAITAENLTKIYKLYPTPFARVKESVNPFGRTYHHEFHALRNVSFEVARGETFGIIGHNGAGKSTLLKLISGVLTPTAGSVQVNGNISALLELGSGFNPELTGIENVFFNGTLAGFSRAQIEDRLDEVLAFADIGEFVHQPVKMYSSGMFIRLAFAVSTMLDPQVLILDEALAVGDIFFQQKCYKRLEQLQKSGVAVLVVSHNLADIMQHCQRALVLNRGEVFFYGDARESVKKFYLLQQQASAQAAAPAAAVPVDAEVALPQAAYFWPQEGAFLALDKALMSSDGLASCTGVAICDESGIACQAFLPGAEAVVYFEFQVDTDIEIPVGGVIICNSRNIIVHGRNTLECPTDAPSFVRRGDRVRFRQRVKLDIAPGEYTFNVGLSSLARADAARRNEMSHAELLQTMKRLCHADVVGSFSISGFPAHYPSERYHHGICNLPGDAEIYLERQAQER